MCSKGYYLYYFIILEENKKGDILGFSSHNKAEGSISFVFAISLLSLSQWYFLKSQNICLKSSERFV